MSQQIHSDAAPDVGQIRELMTPQKAVEQHSVYEQRDRPGALLRVADSARGGLHDSFHGREPPPTVAKARASFSLWAHSSQHTSTVLPPILTLMELPSSLQSQAAQVFSNMTFSSRT